MRDEARYRANAPKAVARADESPTVPAAREQLCCWLQCDDCRRWRLIERKAFPAVDPEGYSRRKDVPAWEPYDWGAWLARAGDRYESYRDQHTQLEVAENPEEFAIDEQPVGVEPDGWSPGQGVVPPTTL